MLEAVRVDVKIDEVQSQIDKLQSEVNMKESQIAEKESNLVLQVKRFKSVVELDVTVAPVKAKDTILQVLDTKYRKLELINTQLLEKQRNFQRAYEDSRFQTLQVEHSIATLTAELDKVVARKQEEFKREVLLNSQKVYTDDVSSVFAVTTKLSDEEVDTLKQDIERRNVTKHSLSERSAELQGRIDEIGRQVAINNAEMATLQTERNNINNRYNEIVASNRNENVFHYLKALESNNGTRYLLDVQQDAVKSEAELAEAKRALDNARTKLAGLKSRLRYLLETQQTLDSAGGHALEQLIVTNDQIKDNLAGIGEGLSANYEQYRILSQQLEDNELKAARVNEQMVELSKTIKVNENQIALSTEKAKKLAGAEDIEEALNNFRYELDDVESEKQMLTESKMSVEKDVFKKRLELEKLQFMFESKSKEYDELLSEVQVELNVNGIDQSTVKLFKFDEDTNEMRKTVADYDQQRVLLSERIENYYQLLKSQSGDAEGVDNTLDISQKVADIQTKIDILAEKQAVLLEQRAAAVSMYMAAASDKIKLAMATVEAKSLSDVRRLLKQNEIIKLLVEDKIKAIVEPAGKLLNTFVDGSYHLVVSGTYVAVRDGMNVLTFDELTTDLRYAVYVALLLALTGPTSARWLIFEEKPSITRPLLATIMSRAVVFGVTDVVKAEVAAQTTASTAE
jgi:chromosome segregation ATPase